jgi:uncharacterized protein (DUF58 family)
MRMGKLSCQATTEEYTVTVAASLAQYFLRRDRAVGLLAYGQSNEIVQPDRGERQINRFWRHWLCCVRKGRYRWRTCCSRNPIFFRAARR